MSERYTLRCRECHRDYGNKPSFCEDCMAPLEVHYDLEAMRPMIYARGDCGAAGEFVALRGIAAAAEGFRSDLPVGFTPLVRVGDWGSGWLRGAAGEERCGLFSIAVVQGSRGGGGPGAAKDSDLKW